MKKLISIKQTAFLILLIVQFGYSHAKKVLVEKSITKVEAHQIGDAFGGGIIFYVDASGQHGLIAAPADQSTNVTWGVFKNPVGANAVELGTGLQNTKLIAKAAKKQQIAAVICYNLELSNYTDWYLPSKDELNLMYNNLHLKKMGNFKDALYWSSSETDFDNAWLFDFKNNHSIEHNFITHACVRAIRSF